ncbi:MAG: hypothetical protein WBO45_25875 [Planctomycetota bacterium]
MTEPGEHGMTLGAKLNADGSMVYFYFLKSRIPSDWRRRLRPKVSFGIPGWKLDDDLSVSFDLTDQPPINTYAVQYYQEANGVGQSMSDAEFAAVQRDGLVVRGLTLTHRERKYEVATAGSASAVMARGLALRVRQLGWK